MLPTHRQVEALRGEQHSRPAPAHRRERLEVNLSKRARPGSCPYGAPHDADSDDLSGCGGSRSPLNALFVPVPLMFLGAIVIVVQTLVFSLLTSIYIGLATEHEEH